MRTPDRFAEHLRTHGYHPRSNKHSNAILEFLLDDLLEACPVFADHAASGRVVYALNRKVRAGASVWNVDLVIGPPGEPVSPARIKGRIAKAQPSNFRIACEAKSIMTEHRKAQRNRQRDLDALHQFLHRYDQKTIVSGVVVVNIATSFRSPLRNSTTTHHSPASLVKSAVELLRMLPHRTQPSEGPGLEASGVIIVDCDNAARNTKCKVYTRPPAPQPGVPDHWASFVRRLCDLYIDRWGR